MYNWVFLSFSNVKSKNKIKIKIAASVRWFAAQEQKGATSDFHTVHVLTLALWNSSMSWA